MQRCGYLRWLAAGLLGLLVACDTQEEDDAAAGGAAGDPEVSEVSAPDTSDQQLSTAGMTPQQVFERMQAAMLARDARTLFHLMDPDKAREEGMTLDIMEEALQGSELPQGWDALVQQQGVETKIAGDMATLTTRKPDGTASKPFRLRRVTGEWKILGQ